jgi:hypothetical protein
MQDRKKAKNKQLVEKTQARTDPIQRAKKQQTIVDNKGKNIISKYILLYFEKLVLKISLALN